MYAGNVPEIGKRGWKERLKGEDGGGVVSKCVLAGRPFSAWLCEAERTVICRVLLAKRRKRWGDYVLWRLSIGRAGIIKFLCAILLEKVEEERGVARYVFEC